MNISLKDFTKTEFESYLKSAIDEYATANIKAGRWTKENAKKNAQDQFDLLLKDGLTSEGHFFWKICLDGKNIGDFWFFQNPKKLEKVFVYDTIISKANQNKGIVTNTFPFIKDKLKKMGVLQIGLHVFAHNTGAIRLYERLGFEYSSHNMTYSL